MPNTPELLKDFIHFFAVPINFQIMFPSQTNFPPTTGMRNITRPTNVRQPLKSLNRLTIPHTVAPSRDNTYRILLQNHGSEYLFANGRYCNGLPKGLHFDQFQKQISKSTACLPQYIGIVHAVGQQFLPIVKNFVSNPLIPGRNLGLFITRHKDCPIELGFGMRAHIIQIVGSFENLG